MLPHTHSCRHLVHFYKDDAPLRSGVGSYVGEALREGRSALVIARPALCQQLTMEVHRQHVQGAPFGPARGRFVTMDAAATLDQVCLDGRPDATLFNQVVGAALTPLASTGEVAAYGEMVALLCERGQYADAVAVEGMWNQLLSVSPVSLYCAYPSRLFDLPGAHAFRDDILAAHNEVRVTDLRAAS